MQTLETCIGHMIQFEAVFAACVCVGYCHQLSEVMSVKFSTTAVGMKKKNEKKKRKKERKKERTKKEERGNKEEEERQGGKNQAVGYDK